MFFRAMKWGSDLAAQYAGGCYSHASLAQAILKF